MGVFAAMMSPVPAEAGAAGSTPIYLVAEPLPEGVRIKVMGASERDYEATFSLEVMGGGNQSRHRSSARLRGGEPVTLSTVTVGTQAEWTARLRVEPRDGEAYEQIRGSR
jgi:hypothetical protein